MFLSRGDKILLLLHRIDEMRYKTLFWYYKSYSEGERRIRRLKAKIERLGGDTNMMIKVEAREKEGDIL